MKVNILKDAKGKVVATFESAATGSPAIKPVPMAGETVLEVDTEENYKADIKAFYQKHSA
jgi:hypothetical protein